MKVLFNYSVHRYSPVALAVSRRLHCRSLTLSMFRLSCVEARHTQAALVCLTRSTWRTTHLFWRSVVRDVLVSDMLNIYILPWETWFIAAEMYCRKCYWNTTNTVYLPEMIKKRKLAGRRLKVILSVNAIFWQIQFPALDIRLSYNDIQLFLAIAKSIPTASASLPRDLDTTSSTSSEPPAVPKDHFRQKSEALSGVYKLDHCPFLWTIVRKSSERNVLVLSWMKKVL